MSYTLVCGGYLSGLLLLEQYKKELKQYETDRQELANAERLFDLPITMYPELVQVQKEMSGLEKIYDIYKEQKVSLLKNSVDEFVYNSRLLWIFAAP